jgi:hypothetical protein
MSMIQACGRVDDLRYPQLLNAVLQHFSVQRMERRDVRVGGLAPTIAGWCCWLRIYSRGEFGYFGVPVEEFNEAYLSA